MQVSNNVSIPTLRDAVDCDAHILEPPDLWQRYLEPKFRDRAIRIEQGELGERLVIDQTTVLEGALAGLGGAHLPRQQLFTPGMRYLDGCPPGSFDVPGRLKLMDDWGVSHAVIFPTICILPFPTEDTELANAYGRAYNTWQAEYSQAMDGRAWPIAVLNWHDVDDAARELDRCLKLGFRGVFVPPETINEKSPADTSFDPIWSRCAEAGVPGCLHVIVRFQGAAIPFRAWHETKPGASFTFGMGAVGQLLPAVASMVVSGVFDRYPTLKVVSVEAGCGFAAYLMDRLDEKHRVFGFGSPLKLKPSDYFRRNLYFVAEPEERSIGAMLDLVGEDRIVWGSDYPHVDATPQAAEFILESVAGLSAQRQRNVLSENARKLFGQG